MDSFPKQAGGWRPRTAWPVTVLAGGPDDAWIVAGEDVRYALEAPAIARWLPQLLKACDGSTPIADIVGGLGEGDRDEARELMLQLYDEGVLINGLAADAHVGNTASLSVEGQGVLADALTATCGPVEEPSVTVFAQDTLAYGDLLAFNRRALTRRARWLWVSVGPLSRAYISPLFLPDAGPCAACLLGRFGDRSPTPQLHSLMAQHHHTDGPATRVLSNDTLLAVAHLTRWKLQGAAADLAPPHLFDLHVVEFATLEVSRYPVMVEPSCDACRRYPRLHGGTAREHGA